MKKCSIILAAMLGLFGLTAPKQVNPSRVLKADTETTHTHEGWKAIDDTIDSFLTKENDKYYLNEGNYYLSDELTLDKDIYIKGDTEVNLCLNGRLVTSKLKESTSSYQFHIESNGKFNVVDENETKLTWYFYDQIDSSGNANEDGIFEAYSYQFDKYHGTLYGKDYLKVEGGVFAGFLTAPIFVDEFATFTMNGGNFAGNFSTSSGSCLFCRINSQTTLNDVTFTGNYAPQGGAIYASNTTKVTLNNVNASYNKSVHGGFMYSSGEVNINDGVYQHNEGDKGSFIYTNPGCTLNINGGDFEFNHAGNMTTPSSSGLIHSDEHARTYINYNFKNGVFKNNITYTDSICDQEDGGAFGVLSNYFFNTSTNKISLGGSTIMDENYVVNLNEYSKGTYKASECNVKLYNTTGSIFTMLNGDNAPSDGMSIGVNCVDPADSGMTIATGLDKDYSAYFTSDIESMYVSSVENGGSYSLQCLSASATPAYDGSETIDPVYPAVEDKTIVSVEKVSTKDGVDTYQITYSDETTSTFTMTAEKQTETSTNNALPIVAIVLSAVSLVGIGGLSFFLFRKRQ